MRDFHQSNELHISAVLSQVSKSFAVTDEVLRKRLQELRQQQLQQQRRAATASAKQQQLLRIVKLPTVQRAKLIARKTWKTLRETT